MTSTTISSVLPNTKTINICWNIFIVQKCIQDKKAVFSDVMASILIHLLLLKYPKSSINVFAPSSGKIWAETSRSIEVDFKKRLLKC